MRKELSLSFILSHETTCDCQTMQEWRWKMPQDKWFKSISSSREGTCLSLQACDLFPGEHIKRRATCWASYISLVVDPQRDSPTPAHGQQRGLPSPAARPEYLFPLRLCNESPAPASLTVAAVPSLINSLEKKGLSNQTNLGCSAEVSRLKRRKIESANYLWEAGTLVYLFSKELETSTQEKTTPIVICIVFSTCERLLQFSSETLKTESMGFIASRRQETLRLSKKRKSSAFISIKLSVFSYQHQHAFSCLYNTAFITLSTLLLLTKWKCMQTWKLVYFFI